MGHQALQPHEPHALALGYLCVPLSPLRFPLWAGFAFLALEWASTRQGSRPASGQVARSRSKNER